MSSDANVALYFNSSISNVYVACTKTSHCYYVATYDILMSHSCKHQQGVEKVRVWLNPLLTYKFAKWLGLFEPREMKTTGNLGNKWVQGTMM
jgi:hypothetical protein